MPPLSPVEAAVLPAVPGRFAGAGCACVLGSCLQTVPTCPGLQCGAVPWEESAQSECEIWGWVLSSQAEPKGCRAQDLGMRDYFHQLVGRQNIKLERLKA